MYNELNNIKRSIEDQTNQTESRSQKKYKMDNNLLIKLEYFIRLYKESKKQDIYNVTIQDEIIQKTIRSCFGELQSQLDASNPVEFVENYRTQDDRPDEEYCYIFCMRHYLQSCRNVEKYLKNGQSKNDVHTSDYRERIAIEKWNLQRQKEQLKIKQLEQKIAQNEQKYNMRQAPKQPVKTICKTSGSGGEIAKVLLYLMFAPIAIFGFIIYGFISAAAKTK